MFSVFPTKGNTFELLGAFHSTKTFKNLKTGVNGTGIAGKSFQKFDSGNWMRTIQPKILEIPRAKWMERNLPGKKIFENLGIPREVVLCLRNLWKHCSIHFCQKFRLEVRVEWKAPIIFFSAFTGTTKIFCSICLDNLQCRQPLGRTRNIIGIL